MRINVQCKSLLIDALVGSGISRSRVKKRLRAGMYTVNGEVETRATFVVDEGDIVGAQGAAPAASVPVLHDGLDFIVVDKPIGLLSVPAKGERNAQQLLEGDLGSKLFRVHRLDRETSGVLLFAKSKDAAERLIKDWRKVEKKYLAVVEGVPDPQRGSIDAPLRQTKSLDVVVDQRERGRYDARTHYRVLQAGASSSLWIFLDTGRKHQIRVHMAHIGHPVVGDIRYGKRDRRLLLHACVLDLSEVGGQVYVAPVPTAFSAYLPPGWQPNVLEDSP